MAEDFRDPFAEAKRKLVSPNGSPVGMEIDLWSIPKQFHGQIRTLVWRWELSEDGMYHWRVMLPALPILEFSVPFDRLSLRHFAEEIIRMLDTNVPSETPTD